MQSNRSETEPLKSRLVGLYMYDWKTRISVMQDLIRLTVHCTAYKTTNGTSALSTMRVNTHKYSLLFGLNSDPSCRRRSGFCEIWMDGSMAQTQCFFGQVWEENETLRGQAQSVKDKKAVQADVLMLLMNRSCLGLLGLKMLRFIVWFQEQLLCFCWLWRREIQVCPDIAWQWALHLSASFTGK